MTRNASALQGHRLGADASAPAGEENRSQAHASAEVDLGHTDSDSRPALPTSAGLATGSVLLVAAWFGLAVGLLEGGTKTLLRGVPGFIFLNSPDILWIAPAFDVVLFLAMGIGLAFLFRALGSRPSVPLVVGVFTWAGLLCLLLALGKTSQLASLLLSTGVALQLARWLRGREQGLVCFLRRSLAALLVTALVAGLIGAQWDGWRERGVVARLVPAPSDAPNLLVIVLDTLRADHVSAYGYGRPTTPNIDRLARGGVLFEDAIANSSWTLPSHASLLTGKLPHEHKADWLDPLAATYPTLAEVLAARGYVTAAFAANTAYVTPEWGLARGFSRFEVYGSALGDDAMRTVYGRKLALTLLPRIGYFDIPGRKRAADVNAEFLGWLDKVSGRPFFALLNYFDVHDPYLTAADYEARFAAEVSHGDLVNFQFQPNVFRRKPTLSAREIQMEIDGYDGCLTYLDAELGRLFAELAKRGLDQRTLVVLTADHGESFGNHDLFGHGNSLYFETLHVPLILSWPTTIPSAVRVPGVASLHQIPATVMDLFGIGPAPLPARSLAKRWTTAAGIDATEAVLSEVSPGRFKEGPPSYPTTAGGLRSLVTDQWHLILSASGHAELYAWREDRDETRNLAETPAGRSTIPELTRDLPAS